MDNKQQEFEIEQKRLEDTILLANAKIEEARTYNDRKKAEILEAKREMRENTEHSIGSLWSSDSFEALAEMNQYANAVNEKLIDYEEVEKKIKLLEKMLDSPYFARIDFQFEEEDVPDEIYIGRTSLKDEHSHKIYIYDWRSPIASVFYRFVLGNAFYDAPDGRIRGTVNLKRQYEISEGKLEYYFDAEVQIVDEFLKKLLSQNTSPKMKTIVETIQKEQDVVIRDMSNELLMVQGVAGSGKTSIAMHRAAYLMYEGLADKLTAENIMIISPNTLFEQYISNVLPELGESNIVSTVFETLALEILQKERIQTRNQFLEGLMVDSKDSAVMKSSIEYKTSNGFKEVLDLFVKDLPLRWIPFTDICFEGQQVIEKGALRNWILKRMDAPLGIRLKQLEDHVLEKIRAQAGRRLRKAEVSEIRSGMQAFTELNARELYKALFEDRDYFTDLTEKIQDCVCTDEIWNFTAGNLGERLLRYDDAIPMTYFYLKLFGTESYRKMKQVVIDEAQDYYPLQFEIFSLLFKNAKYTVLGDMNQTLEKQEDLSLYEGIQRILHKKKASLITMDKSFRCTNEILNYSLKFIDHDPKIQSFNREGDAPVVYEAENPEQFCSLIQNELEVCKANEYQSVGLICKSAEEAERLYDILKNVMDIKDVKEGSNTDLQGVFIIPVYMSKGLEFDAVLICDADARNYKSDEDKKLLYIASTRALHRLNLFCEGKASPLLK